MNTPSSTNNLFDRPLPPGYRDELQALEALPRPAYTRSRGSWLVFLLGDLRLALPASVASAVAPVLHIARVPHRSSTVLLGLCAFRGEILPCCSLSTLLGLGPAERASTQSGRTLILEESPTRRWAVPIDGVLGVQPESATDNQIPAPISAHWLRGSVADASGTLHLLDHELLFRQLTLATA